MEVQLMKRAGETTKRAGETTKRAGETTKRLAEISETAEAYFDSGADGDYTVTTPNGEPVNIKAIAIRVLDHGELNLLTDTGRWFLFAPNAWRSAFPTQPKPGV
jgi:hypothetical protein